MKIVLQNKQRSGREVAKKQSETVLLKTKIIYAIIYYFGHCVI